MNEVIHCITNKTKTPKKNGKMMTLTFVELYTVHLKKLGQFFFCTYLLTCLKKDKSVKLKVTNI